MAAFVFGEGELRVKSSNGKTGCRSLRIGTNLQHQTYDAESEKFSAPGTVILAEARPTHSVDSKSPHDVLILMALWTRHEMGRVFCDEKG